MTEPVKIGWKKLRTILNDVIIKNLNLQKPLKGDGISLSQTASGTIISAIQKGDDTSGGKDSTGTADAGPDTAGWQSMIVIDSSDCSQRYIWYWGTAPSTSLSVLPPATHPVSTQ